jgi:glycosyltransferase involved in cell wall biosynthesis
MHVIQQAPVSMRPSARAVPGGPNGEPPLRVWLLTNAPSPYQSELLSAISDRPDLALEVRFLQSGSPAGRASARRFASRVLRSATPTWLPVEMHLHPRAVWECLAGRHDCYVLSGLYTNVTFLMCALVLTMRRVPWLVWLERPHLDDPKVATWSPRWLASSPIRWIRNRVRSALWSSSNRLICIGTLAREEYRSQGVPAARLDVLPYCCDIDRYAAVAPERVRVLKRRLRCEGQTVFLFSGQMNERKGVDVVLAAFGRVAEECPDTALVLLGDGPRREEFEHLVPFRLRSRVHFAGHVPQEELPDYFAAADVFVFPSRHDGWGVVVNEACAAGLPVIATCQTGAAHDLVVHGQSGFLMQREDVAGFAAAMRHFVDHPQDRVSFGKRSRELVEEYSPAKGAARFHQAIAAACRCAGCE